MGVDFDFRFRDKELRAYFFDDAFDIFDIILKGFHINSGADYFSEYLFAIDCVYLQIIWIFILEVYLISRRAVVQGFLELGIYLNTNNKILLNHPIIEINTNIALCQYRF